MENLAFKVLLKNFDDYRDHDWKQLGLKAHSLRTEMIASLTEEEPEMYETEELGKLFAACDAKRRQWCEFFLMTGIREQELM